MIINTIENQSNIKDSMILRRNAINQKIPYFTTLRAAKAAINSIDQLINYKLSVKPIQKLINLNQNNFIEFFSFLLMIINKFNLNYYGKITFYRNRT